MAGAVLALLGATSLASLGTAQGWAEITAPGGPAGLNSIGAYDSVHRRFLALIDGGATAMAFYNDQTASWTSLPPAATDGFQNSAFAYDSHRDRFVRFGGATALPWQGSDITWEYDPGAGTWHNVSPAQRPSPRKNAVMAFDTSRNRMVLFGGQRPHPTFFGFLFPLNDTWEYDGTTWTPITTASNPPTGLHAMAFDTSRGRMILQTENGQTWEYDGQVPSWTLVNASGPSSRAVVFDSIRNVLQLWTADAVEFDPVSQQWTTVATGVHGGAEWVYFDPSLAPNRRVIGHSLASVAIGATARTFEYRPDAIQGSVQNYGTAFGNGGLSSFCEIFYSTMDLAGTAAQTNSLLLHRTGPCYEVMQGNNQWFTPPASSPNLLLGDDAETTVNMPFTMPLLDIMTPSSSNQIVIGSNGYVIPTGTSAGPYIISSGVSGLEALYGVCSTDLDPSSAGSIQFDVDPNGAAAYVTWTNVPAYNQPGSAHTFQLALFANGDVEYRYQQVVLGATQSSLMVGWSPGTSLTPRLGLGGAAEPPAIDLTASVPFRTGCEVQPHLSSQSYPMINRTLVIDTTDLPLTSSFGVTILGFTKFDPGIDLTPIGLDGCQRYASIDSVMGFVSSGMQASVNVQIPNWTALVGVRIYAQSAVVIPGVNPTGIATTEGLEFLIGEL